MMMLLKRIGDRTIRVALVLFLLVCSPVAALAQQPLACGEGSMAMTVLSEANRRNLVFTSDEFCSSCIPGSYTALFPCASDPKLIYAMTFEYAGFGDVSVPFGGQQNKARYFGALRLSRVSDPFPFGFPLWRLSFRDEHSESTLPAGISIPPLALGSLREDEGQTGATTYVAINRDTGEIYIQTAGKPAPLILRDGHSLSADSPR